MKKIIRLLTLSFAITLALSDCFMIFGTFAQEKQIKEGDIIIIELFYGRKLHGAFVRMDSINITYIPSGKTAFFKPGENTVKLEKVKKIYDKKGWVLYVTPKYLRNYDYPTSEFNIGYSTMFYNEHTYSFGNSREHKGGITISGGGTIKKWLSAELRLNTFSKEGGFLQVFLSLNKYYKKHRFFAGAGGGAYGTWLIMLEPFYSAGFGSKIYLHKDLHLRVGIYDYIMPSFDFRKNNIIFDIGLTIAEW